MQSNHGSKMNFILAVLIISGCSASFEPRLNSQELLKDGRLPTVKEVRGGLEVSVEEYASPNKSRRAFDTELASYGVLPLLVRVENRGVKNYKVRPSQIRVIQNTEPLVPLYGFEAANEGAMRGYTWHSLVNTVAMGPLAMFF